MIETRNCLWVPGCSSQWVCCWSLYVFVYLWVVNLWAWCYFFGFWYSSQWVYCLTFGFDVNFRVQRSSHFMGLSSLSYVFGWVQCHRTLRIQWWTLIIRFYTSHQAILNCFWVLIVSTLCLDFLIFFRWFFSLGNKWCASFMFDWEW